MTNEAQPMTTHNFAFPAIFEEREEILRGLCAPQKLLSPKYLYDRRGSELFDQICGLPEYYPTRTELGLLEEHLPEVADLVGEHAAVIEFGAGSNIKIRLLLDHLHKPLAYVPVDISPEFLHEQVESLRSDYPNVHIEPVFADFTQPFDLPTHPVEPKRNLVFFPGSTIGNFTRRRALGLLQTMALEAKAGGCLLIGVDIKKDPAILNAAYNDSEGVTAEFNLNLLKRLNRELDAEFEVEHFEHYAHYDEDEHRIEMRLISLRKQQISVAGVPIDFEPGEYIITEYSHKYSPSEFHALAERAGFVTERMWIDDDDLFSLHYLTIPTTE